METEVGEGSGSRKRTNQNGKSNKTAKRAKVDDGPVDEEVEDTEEDTDPLSDDFEESKADKHTPHKSWFVTGFHFERDLIESWIKKEKPDVKHALVGFEICPDTGKSHYHLCMIYEKTQKFAAVKKLISIFGEGGERAKIKWIPNGHYAKIKSYCAKKRTKVDPEKDTIEYGEYVSRSESNKKKCQQMNEEWDMYKLYALAGDLDMIPAEIYLRYFNAFRTLRDEGKAIRARAEAEEAIRKEWEGYTMKEYQKFILEKLAEPANCRDIYWIYDSVGGCGKSRFAAYLEVVKGCCSLTPGKQNDLAHIMDYSHTYIMDIPRCTGEAVSFGFIENLKNGKIVSGKYQGANRLFRVPHFVVFSNAMPPESTDTTGFSKDRIKLVKITSKEGDYQLIHY